MVLDELNPERNRENVPPFNHKSAVFRDFPPKSLTTNSEQNANEYYELCNEQEVLNNDKDQLQNKK